MEHPRLSLTFRTDLPGSALLSQASRRSSRRAATTGHPVLANDQGQAEQRRAAHDRRSTTKGTKGTVGVSHPGGTGLTYDPTGFATGDPMRSGTRSRTTRSPVELRDRRHRRPAGPPPSVNVRHGEDHQPATPWGRRPTKVRIEPWTTIPDAWHSGLKTYQLQESYNGAERFKTVSLARSQVGRRTLSDVDRSARRYRYRRKARSTRPATSAAGKGTRTSSSDGVHRKGRRSGYALLRPVRSLARARSPTASGGKARWFEGGRCRCHVPLQWRGRGLGRTSKSPSRGSAQVLVDGVLVKTVSPVRTSRRSSAGGLQVRHGPEGLQRQIDLVVGTAGHRAWTWSTFVVAVARHRPREARLGASGSNQSATHVWRSSGRAAIIRWLCRVRPEPISPCSLRSASSCWSPRSSVSSRGTGSTGSWGRCPSSSWWASSAAPGSGRWGSTG